MSKNTFKPRDLLNKEVAGICGAARLADKARAAHSGEVGSYKYGADSKQDSGILSFLGISADAFQEASVQHTNDVRLGVWVLDHCSRSDEEISKFNHQLVSWWRKNTPQDYLSKRRRELVKDNDDRPPFLQFMMTGHLFLIGLMLWVGWMLWKFLKRKKENTFQPRDILSKEVAGICGVARLTDKARAEHSGELGSYKYGVDSKQDSGVLTFLGISADTFQEASIKHTNDVRLGAWILNNCNRSDEEILKFNRQLVSWWRKNTPHNYLLKRRSKLTNEETTSHNRDGGCFGAV